MISVPTGYTSPVNEAMRAIQLTSHVTRPSSLPSPITLPDPTPSPTQYLIATTTVALNFFDILQIQGKYQHQPPLPFIPGYEFSGTIISSPSFSSSSNQTAKYQPGTKIFGAKQGAFATRIVAEEVEIRNVPVGWGGNDTAAAAAAAAAGLFVTAPTCYAALVLRAKLQPGEWVLIHAAAGGIGLAAVQIAKALGGFVIATAGTASKLEIAKKYGADKTVDYSRTGWEEEVKKYAPGGKGVDVVIDPVGMVNNSLKCVRWNARIVVVGFAAGKVEEVKMNRVLLKNVSVVGLHWGLYIKEEPERVEEVWEGIEGLIAEGKFGEMGFERRWKGLRKVGEGLDALGGRETWGKVLVDVDEGEGDEDEEEGDGERGKGWEKNSSKL